MVAPNNKPDTLASEAHALYDRLLRGRLEPAQNGKFVVLNLDSGEYELDADDLTALRKARARFGAARLITLRVGGPAAYRLGSSIKAPTA